MDINIFRGIILFIMIISFLGLWAWAWNRKRKSVFYEASMLPMEEDNGIIPETDNETPKNEEEGVSHVD